MTPLDVLAYAMPGPDHDGPQGWRCQWCRGESWVNSHTRCYTVKPLMEDIS